MANKRKLTPTQKAFFKRVGELDDAMADPERLMDLLMDATKNLRDVDPHLAQQVADNQFRRVAMIHRKIPRGPAMGYVGSEYDTYVPPDYTIAKFARYAAAAWSPMSVLDKMGTGRLTKEEADALRDTSPAIYQRVQERFMDKIPEAKGKLPFHKIVELSALFGVPFSTEMDPKSIGVRQAAFAQEEQTPDLSGVKQSVQNQETQSQRLEK